MANKTWRGDQAATAQVNTITPANVGVGNTFTVTINLKEITFTATGTTVANVTAGLVALLQATTIPEFTEILFTDSVTHVTATARTPGKPFTQTSSASGGTATNTTATTIPNTSPNDWNDADNWDPVNVPVNGDDVFIQNTSSSILYGLAQSAVTLASLNIAASFTGQIGLPVYTGSYFEYRPSQLAISATTINVGQGQGTGSSRIKINTGSVQTTVNVFGMAASAEPGLPAFLWKGTHASNVLDVYQGSVGIALLAGETATLLTLNVGYETNVAIDASVQAGTGVTLTTIHQSGGDVTLQSNSTTINLLSGILTVLAGTVTTLNADKGTVFYQSSGTITLLNIGGEGTVDFSRDKTARTVSACNLYRGGTLLDPDRSVTWTAGVDLERTRIADVRIDLGTNIKITPASVT